MQEKLKGKIKWFNEKKEYGYIIGVDEEMYFFERINCIDNNENFNTDDKVLFCPNFGPINLASKVEKSYSFENSPLQNKLIKKDI